MSRLDPFLVTVSRVEFFEHREITRHYYGYRVPVLEKVTRLGGPRAFKFDLSWLERVDILNKLHPWWEEIRSTGNLVTF